jgi:hypothetical protein
MNTSTVLIKFFEETGGRNWAFQDGWLTDQNICNWYGVACNADLSVDGITLKKNRLMPSDERSDVSQGLLRLPNLKVREPCCSPLLPASSFCSGDLLFVFCCSTFLGTGSPRRQNWSRSSKHW